MSKPTTDLPAIIEPPISDDVDLRSFEWMPLNVTQLLNSSFDSTFDDTGWRLGVTLWCKAWHQVPAGSLPDDDQELCKLVGLGRDLKTWQKHKEVALRGFVNIGGAKLYHPVLCEKANEAWESKQKFDQKRKADRDRKAGKYKRVPKEKKNIPPENSKVPTENPKVPTEDVDNPSSHPSEFQRKTLLEGEGEGKESIDINPPIPPKGEERPENWNDDLEKAFDQFFKAYPALSINPALPARKAFAVQVLEKGMDPEIITASLPQYKSALQEPRAPKPCLASKYLNEQRFLDLQPGKVVEGRRPPTVEEAAAYRSEGLRVPPTVNEKQPWPVVTVQHKIDGNWRDKRLPWPQAQKFKNSVNEQIANDDLAIPKFLDKREAGQ